MSKSKASSSIVAERTSLYAAYITGVSALAFSLLLFADQTIPLFGRFSIGLTAAFFASLTTFIMFLVAWKVPRRGAALQSRHLISKVGVWVKRSAVAFVHAALVFLALSALYFVLQQAFTGLTLNALASSVIVALTVAAVSYMLYPIVYKLTLEVLSVVLAAFLGAGVLTSAMSIQDPTWWQYHFSMLGAGSPVSALVFNITLIVAGIVVVTITQLMVDHLQARRIENQSERAKGIDVAGGLLMAVGVALALVGLFNYEDYLTIHNIAASGMGLLFIMLAAALPKLIPGLDASFYSATYALLTGLVLAIVLFVSGIFNLTAFELVCAGIIFCWFIVFVRQVAALHPESELHT